MKYRTSHTKFHCHGGQPFVMILLAVSSQPNSHALLYDRLSIAYHISITSRQDWFIIRGYCRMRPSYGGYSRWLHARSSIEAYWIPALPKAVGNISYHHTESSTICGFSQPQPTPARSTSGCWLPGTFHWHTVIELGGVL
jgi:hypothetical protein